MEYIREFRSLCNTYCALTGKDKVEFSEHLHFIDGDVSIEKAEMLRWINTFYSDLT